MNGRRSTAVGLRGVLFFIGVVFLGACGEQEVVLVLEASDPVDLGDDSRVRWTVYGSDSTVADAAASIIAEGSDGIARFPVKLRLQLPRDPQEQIDQGHGSTNKRDAVFWFGVTVDLDGDDRLCPGDLYEDFEGREPQFFDGEIPARVTIPVTVVPDDRACVE